MAIKFLSDLAGAFVTDTPTFSLSDAEKAIFAIPGLTGWWEADNGVTLPSGFRHSDKLRRNQMGPLNPLPPVVASGPNGKACLQFGYGNAKYGGVNRGALRPSTDMPLLGTAGYTVFTVTRLPSAIESPSGQGGYAWASRGPNSNNTPRLSISGADGRARHFGGGVQCNAAYDQRDGLCHISRALYDPSGSVIKVNVDGTRAASSANMAVVPPDATISNSLAPNLGAFLNTSGLISLPFYGQIYAHITANVVLGTAAIATIENYFSAKYGVTLV